MSVSFINTTASDGASALHQLGETQWVKGALYMYFRANASVALTAYAACSVSNAMLATMLTSTTSGAKPTLVCIPQFAVAVSEYFWAPIGPFYLREDDSTTFKVLAAASCADSVKLYTTATDGTVDDSAADLVAGLLLTETITGAEAADCIAVQTLVTNCQD